MQNISDKAKLEYLNNLLETDLNFKIEFFKYFNLQEKVATSYKNNDLKTITEEIYEVLNDANLELYISDCRCGHGGYYDYYEEDISDELCEDLFLETVKEIDGDIKKGDFYQALFVLVAIGKAIDLKPSVDDEYGLIYDYDEILSMYHYDLISKYTAKLKEANLSLEDSKEFILFLLDNSTTSDELEKFEELFSLLITSKDMVLFVSPNISAFHINMQLKILNLLEDDQAYIDTAKQFYKENNNIAHKLLKKLNEVSIYQEYEVIAKECFEKNDSCFVSEIFQVITYDKSKVFYLELLRYKVLNHHNIDEYILYKKYLDEKEIITLQDKLCSGWSYDYCIKILEYEKRYDKILHLAQSEKSININTVLKPIKFIYPKECLEIIIDNCNRLMNDFGKNRDRYNKICNLLIIMVKVPNVKNDIDVYIKTTLTNRKPKLPALIDELTKARLI
ncbi:MAG: hypothetical protein U9N59_03635 [Campylobacterota bacterium]|nr:hypothetical protein [Campylobacterota bacterium]